MIELTLKGKVVVGFLGALLVIMLYSWMGGSSIAPPPVIDGGDGEPLPPSGTATGFYKVPPQDAQQLINTKKNLIVIDCSIGGADFIAGNSLPNAIWSVDPSAFYMQRTNILLYANDDSTSTDYAKALIGKLFGEIYVLMGGYGAWIAWTGG